MSVPLSSFVPSASESKDIGSQLESFQCLDNTRQQLLERLLRRLSELDAALQATNSDLEDQTSIRRQWKKRAEFAEASLSQNQFVLALVDGNRYTFGDEYIKNTETGGANAAKELVEQIRGYIRKQSLHDNPDEVALMVHIFANKTALTQDLVDSGTISEPGYLDHFIAEFMNSLPFLYFVDCGSSEGAVDAKIQESYEFHFDNAHCKHLLLALRHESGYITELDKYQDESTLARTSLMRSSHAVAGKFASAFHVANTPVLRTIALISLEHTNGNGGRATREPRSSVVRPRVPTRNHDLHGLFEVGDQDCHVPERDGVRERNGSNPPAQDRDSSTTSDDVAITKPGEAAEPIDSARLIQERKILMKLPGPQATAAHQSHTEPYVGSVHAYMNDWENAPSLDIYTPAPDLRPWSSEDVAYGGDVGTTKDNIVRTEQAPTSTPSEVPTTKGLSTPMNGPSGKLAHQHHGTSASPSQKAKPNPMQPLPAPRHHIDVPKYSRPGGRLASPSSLESKYSAPSSKTSGPKSPSNVTVAINRLGQRIDLPLPPPSVDDQARYDLRWRAKKLCNDHHIRGQCSNQDCKFDHEPIDEGVRLALGHFARNVPCKTGTACRRYDCPHGHYCPYRLSRGGCTNKQCGFKARGMHGVDDLSSARFVQGQ